MSLPIYILPFYSIPVYPSNLTEIVWKKAAKTTKDKDFGFVSLRNKREEDRIK